MFCKTNIIHWKNSNGHNQMRGLNITIQHFTTFGPYVLAEIIWFNAFEPELTLF